LGTVYYHTSVSAFGSVAAAREIQISRIAPTVNVNLNAHLNSQGDLMFLSPTYTFATPVLGGQFAVSMTGIFGNINTSIAWTLTANVGPIVGMRSGLISDALFGVGDLYPMMTLKWNNGVNNWMTYATGDIPVGAYDPNRLSNIGIGHGAIDASGAYTYLNQTRGTNFPGWPDSPTTSKTRTHSIRAESISTSIGGYHSFSQNRFSLVWSATSINRSRPIPASIPSLGRLSLGSSELVPKLVTSSRSEKCRDI
jgi:hypothetical protein